MAEVFETDASPLSDEYIDGLLAQPGFWAVTAFWGGATAGGLTAYTLPMTVFEGSDVFLYDIAVRADRQRRGIGRRLVEVLREECSKSGIGTVFVLADDEDVHALDFYRALSGAPSPVTMFEFGRGQP
jgi:aminoglycoside 3-N-acetyltransferase I